MCMNKQPQGKNAKERENKVYDRKNHFLEEIAQGEVRKIYSCTFKFSGYLFFWVVDEILVNMPR